MLFKILEWYVENIFFIVFIHLHLHHTYIQHTFTDLQVAQNVETGSEAACDGDVDDVADLEEAGVSLSISIKWNLRAINYKIVKNK